MSQREHGDPLDALKAELANVTPSPEFQARVRQRIAGEMDLLREELAAVAPSVEFAARVRQGIDAQPNRRAASWVSGWRWVVPVGAVAAGVIAVIALTRSGADAPERVTVQAPVAVEAPTPAVTPPATSNVERRPSNFGRSVAAVRGQVVPAAPPIAEPVLEVITNQPAILRALRARMGGVEMVGEPVAPPSPNAVPDVVVAPVEVSPVVVKWMVEPPASPGQAGGSSVIRRVTAERAERSPK